MAKLKYRWKTDKSPIKAEFVYYRYLNADGTWEVIRYYKVAIEGDFRKGYIKYSEKEFKETFETY